MKKQIIILINSMIFGIAIYSQCDSFIKIGEIPIGMESNQIQYSDSVYRGLSPNGFSFVDGKYAWISEVHSAALLDSHLVKIAKHIKYPTDLFINQPTQFCFVDHLGLLFSPMAEFNLDENYLSISNLSFKPSLDDTSAVRIIAKDGYFFLYGENGKLQAINKEGELIDANKTMEIAIGLYKKNTTETRENEIAQIIEKGYLIVDGIFYPKDSFQLYEYYSGNGHNRTELEAINENGKGTTLVGLSLNGEIAVSQQKDVYIFSQNGQLLKKIIFDSSKIELLHHSEKSGEVIGPLFAINYNGDMYALYVVNEDKAYLFKRTRDWGVNYIRLAKEGINTNEVESNKAMLIGFTNEEIRILKNAFFALKGYKFKSWDMSCYFNGFLWYSPDKMVNDSINDLTENQKRLFDLVISEEKRRK